MIDWWNALSVDLKVFYGIGILALTVTVIQMLLTLIGLGGDAVDLDLEFDGPDANHTSGIGLFSSQTIAAFFLGFGWVGAIARASNLSLLLSVLTAFGVGVLLMFAMLYLLRALLSLQATGPLDYRNAVGQEATVYVTIPGDNQDGGGQVQVTIQGRLTTATARKTTPGAVAPGAKVRVVAMSGPTAFVVEPL